MPAHLHLPAYDYFIVKSSTDRTQALFAGENDVKLDQRIGDWWGHRRLPPGRAPLALVGAGN